MSNHRKSPRGTERVPATNGKAPNAKKQKPAGKKHLKQKIVAAEMGETVRRQEAASPESAPAAAKAKPAQKAEPTPAAKKPVRPAAESEPAESKPKAATTPPQAAEKPAPAESKPAPAAAKPAPAAAKPASPGTKPAPAKPAQVAAKPAQLGANGRAAPAQNLLGITVDTLEQSFKAAGQGTVAVNCKLLDFARVNVNSGLDHAKDLAAARSPVRIMRLQMEYWHDCLETFASQAQEFRALSAEFVARASAPLRQHLRKP
jgi:hypothetical protein